MRKLHSSEKEPDVCAAVREVSKPRDFLHLFSQNFVFPKDITSYSQGNTFDVEFKTLGLLFIRRLS